RPGRARGRSRRPRRTDAPPRARERGRRGAPPRLFLDRGFDATSLDAVAEAARVSKPTVYSRYGDKRGLFAAVLRREIERWLAPLSAAAETQLSSQSDISAEQRLVQIGRGRLTITCGPDAPALSRITRQQANNFPDVCK